METLDYRKNFIENVNNKAVLTGITHPEAFTEIALSKLCEFDEISQWQLCFCDQSGYRNKKYRLDGYALDDTDDSISLFITLYMGNDNMETLTQTIATKELSYLENYVKDAINGSLKSILEESTPTYGFAYTLIEKRTEISKIKLYLLTDAIASKRMTGHKDNTIDNISIMYHIWDISRFQKIEESNTGRDILEVNFKTSNTPNGIPYLQTEQSKSDYDSYLSVVPGNVLADLYDNYGSRLLEGNVRSFLSLSGKVNKNIRSTILKEPEKFFALNNGISTTATSIDLKNGRILKAQDFQIVNGGQTTATLSTTRKKDNVDLSKIFVAMKISVVKTELAEKLIPEISRSANSQNKVSDADFFSNHPYHVRLEEFSRRLFAPAAQGTHYGTHWFYERARAQYINELAKLTSSHQALFKLENPREQVITKTDHSKFELTWECFPHVVSLGAQKNFLKFAEIIDQRWRENESNFNELYFKHCVAKAIIFKQTEKLISEQPWYREKTGYRANLVTYTIAKIINDVKLKFPKQPIDLDVIWKNQNISGAWSSQIILVSKLVFDVIYSPLQKYSDIGEWVKKELCWDRIKEAKLELITEFINELANKEDLLTNKHVAKQKQKLDNGIKFQSLVYELGADYWTSLLQWGEDKKLLDSKKRLLLRKASLLPNKPVQDFEAQELLQIKANIESEGFTYSA